MIPKGAGLHAYDWKRVSMAARTVNQGPILTQQQFQEDADINVIVRRFGLTRSLPAAVAAGVYGDFTGIHDFESAVATIEGARRRFMELPAPVRDKFENDPGRLIQYVESHTPEEWEALMTPPVVLPVVPAVPAVPVP